MAASMYRPKPSSRGVGIVTIQSGDVNGLSDIINISGLTLSSIQVTSQGWTAASIGFNANVDGSTAMFPVYNSLGDYLTLPCSAGRIIAFDPAQFSGLQLMHLVSRTTAGVAVQQGADRTIKLGLSEYVEANL